MAISDELLLEAMRKRLLRQIEKEDERATINNNLYAGGADNAKGGGIMSSLGQGGDGDPFDYLVDIERDDKKDPATGKTTGWKKKVHRYRVPKGSEPPPK